jgi:hypothetical protein
LNNPRLIRIAKSIEQTHPLFVAMSDADSDEVRNGTRNAARHSALHGVVAVWLIANQATDGILRFTSTADLDDITGIGGFGNALVAAGWAERDEENDCIILPNFYEHNTIESEHNTRTGAERQSEYRKRQKELAKSGKSDAKVTERDAGVTTRDVTRDVTRDGGVTKSDATDRGDGLDRQTDRQTNAGEGAHAQAPSESASVVHKATPTLDLVLHQGAMAGVPADYCRSWYNDREVEDWRDARGNDRRPTWLSWLKRWWQNEQEQRAKGKGHIEAATEEKDYTLGWGGKKGK